MFIRNSEKGGCCSLFMWMQTQPLFIPFDRALASTGIELLNIPDANNSDQSAQSSAPRRPAGPGHSLQSSNESSWSVPSFNLFSNKSEVSKTTDSSMHRGHALADRLEKSKNEVHPQTMKSATGEAYFTPLPADYYDNKKDSKSAVFEIGDPEHIDDTADTPSNPYEYRPVTHGNGFDDEEDENNNGKNNK